MSVELSLGDTRLLKLAEHLENGKLGHEIFDFRVFNKDVEKYDDEGREFFDYVSPKAYFCGTNGCAIGECVTVFPDKWTFNYVSEPVLLGDYPRFGLLHDSLASAMQFFDLNPLEVHHLFIPCMQKLRWGMYLDSDATKEDVARNIRRFVELRSKNQL